MTLFTALLLRIIPLYATVALGFVAARVLGVQRESVSKIVLYIAVPIVFFHGTYHAAITPQVLGLPFLALAISTILCLVFFQIGAYRKDGSRNVLALAAGNGNTGYFGLPVAAALFDRETVGVYIVLMIGVSIYESTLGFYVTARGKHTVHEALLKLFKLPPLYGFLLGLFMNQAGIPLPSFLDEFFLSVRGCYVILGMMIVGLALASISSFKLDWGFIGLCFLARFIGWPLLGIGFVFLDRAFFHLYPEPIHGTIILLSIVPMAANTVVIADLLHTQPEKVASAVFLSTLVALFYVPLMAAWLIK